MENLFTEVKLENKFILPTEVTAPEGYIVPKNDRTGQTFPYCCEPHSVIYQRQVEWFEKFPKCCPRHSSILRYKWFNKALYKDVPTLILNRLSYTEHIIKAYINDSEWFEIITDYIDYINTSFGIPSIGANEYLSDVNWYIKSQKLPEDKRARLIKFMAKYDAKPKQPSKENSQTTTDLNVLYHTYQKWLKEFPFHLSLFSHLKDRFERQLPFAKDKPTINRFSGYACFTPHSKESLKGYLLQLTDTILREINTSKMYEGGLLSKPEIIKLELVLSERKLKLKEGYTSKSKSEEDGYRKALKNWYKDEIKFIKDIEPYLINKTTEPEKTNGQYLSERLSKYGFFELEKVKSLSQESQFALIELLAVNKMPYNVAMLDFLGFIDQIQKKYSRTLDKRNSIISKIFDSDKDGRTIKGLINSLHKPEQSRYTAHLHRQTVQNDYQKLT